MSLPPAIGPDTECTRRTPQLLFEGEDHWPANISLEGLQNEINRLLHVRCRRLTPKDFGKYHVVVEVELTNGQTVVARINGMVDDEDREIVKCLPPFWDSCEAATAMYVREHTTIPVPDILAVGEDECALVGGRFRLETLAGGWNLADLWSCLSLEAQTALITQIAQIRLQLFHLKFDRIGSLHRTSPQLDNASEYTVGPMVTFTGLNTAGLHGPPTDPGPWSGVREWLKNRARGGMLYQSAGRLVCDPEILEMIDSIIDQPQSANGLPIEGELAECGLDVPDMNLRQFRAHISPDEQGHLTVTICSVLDWEGAQVVPRFILAERPRWYGVEETLMDHCNQVMRQDELFRRAQDDGFRGRELYHFTEFASRAPITRDHVDRFRKGEPYAC